MHGSVYDGKPTEHATKQEKRYSAELDDTFQEYDKLKERAMELDYDALMSERLRLQPDEEQAAISHVESSYGDEYQPTIMVESNRDVATVIDEKERREAQRLLHRKQDEQSNWGQKKTSKEGR